MTQSDLGFIDPNETSGVELASMLSAFNAALRTSHKGSARPSYAERGTMWLQDTGSSVINWFMFDGVDDLYIGAFNTTTNTFATAGGVVTLASLGGVPTSRTLTSTGSLTGLGDFTTNRTVNLKGDEGTVAALKYYGTNSAGTQGFHSLTNVLTSVTPNRTTRLGAFGPGSHDFTIPTGCTSFTFQAWAGGGGDFFWSNVESDENGNGYVAGSGSSPGGWGACASGSVDVIPGQTYVVTVGGAGTSKTQQYGSSQYYDDGGTDGGNTVIRGSAGDAVVCRGGARATLNGGAGAGGTTTVAYGVNAADWSSPLMTGGYQAGAPAHYGLVLIWYNV